jgi:hypothetical protein
MWKKSKPLNWVNIIGYVLIPCAPLATEPGISLIILTSTKILQRNLNRGTFVVWEIKRNVSVVCVCSAPNILISDKIIKEMPGSVESGTHCIMTFIIVCQFQSTLLLTSRSLVHFRLPLHIKQSSAGTTVIKLALLFYLFVTRIFTLSTARLPPTANFPNFLI